MKLDLMIKGKSRVMVNCRLPLILMISVNHFM